MQLTVRSLSLSFWFWCLWQTMCRAKSEINPDFVTFDAGYGEKLLACAHLALEILFALPECTSSVPSRNDAAGHQRFSAFAEAAPSCMCCLLGCIARVCLMSFCIDILLIAASLGRMPKSFGVVTSGEPSVSSACSFKEARLLL